MFLELTGVARIEAELTNRHSSRHTCDLWLRAPPPIVVKAIAIQMRISLSAAKQRQAFNDHVRNKVLVE